MSKLTRAKQPEKKKEEGPPAPPLPTPLNTFYCATCRKLVYRDFMILDEEGYYRCKVKCQRD